MVKLVEMGGGRVVEMVKMVKTGGAGWSGWSRWSRRCKWGCSEEFGVRCLAPLTYIRGRHYWL